MSLKRLNESWWSNTCVFGGAVSTSQLIPTPPRSPSRHREDSLSSLEMVNPNSILDETTSHMADSLDLSLDLPFPVPLDLKFEEIDTWTNLCQHGFADTFCSTCSKDGEKKEVLNDFMWAQGAVQQTTSATAAPQASFSLRTHHDSISSRYSDFSDPSIGLYDTEELSSPTHRLETPSESSDSETEHPIAETVYLDHNYHSINHRRRSDIRSPLRKALSRVSKAQTDSDDEIDVVSVSDSQTQVFSRVPQYHGLVNIFESEDEEIPASTVAPVKRGRRSAESTTASKKLGRPCKSKRINNNRVQKPLAKRCSSRALQMDPQKRSLHNSMERMRRVDLKMCFEILRSLIPSLKDRARAPKVMILQSANDCIKTLQRIERKSLIEIEKRKQSQRKLLVKLQRLKEEAAIAGKEFG